MATTVTEIPKSSQHLVVQDDSADTHFQRRCCFFWFTSFPSDRSIRRVSCFHGGCWERVNKTTHGSEKGKKWWAKRWKRVQEWSEAVTGPRWKTFIRRFNKNGRQRGRYHQYNLLSYALNFDEGGCVHDPEYAYGEFSSRFAAPWSGKSRDFSSDIQVPLFLPVEEEEEENARS